jgi:hypothetical protein
VKGEIRERKGEEDGGGGRGEGGGGTVEGGGGTVDGVEGSELYSELQIRPAYSICCSGCLNQRIRWPLLFICLGIGSCFYFGADSAIYKKHCPLKDAPPAQQHC